MYWTITADKKAFPVNAAHDPIGGFVVTLKPDGTLYAEAYLPTQHGGRNRYTSHFATCPNAGQHRRK